jgi:hypothetical protein
MSIKNKCDKCGKKTNELALLETYPNIIHWCWKCCNEEDLDIKWIGNSGVSFHLY